MLKSNKVFNALGIQIAYVKVQQTPNPAAQLPSTLPDFAAHSDSARQVPYMEELDFVVHWLKKKEYSFYSISRQQTVKAVKVADVGFIHG